MPAYHPELPDQTGGEDMAPPELKIACVKDGMLALPDSIRGKWLDDPIRKQEWATEVAAFDARFLVFNMSCSGIVIQD